MNRGALKPTIFFLISFWKPVTTAMVIKLTTMVSAILIMDMRMIGLETFIPFLLFLRILSAMKYSKDKYLFFNTQKYTKLLCLEFIFLFLLFSCHSNQKPIGDKLKGIHSEKLDTNIGNWNPDYGNWEPQGGNCEQRLEAGIRKSGFNE